MAAISLSAEQLDSLQEVCAFQPVLETYRREFGRSLEYDYGL